MGTDIETHNQALEGLGKASGRGRGQICELEWLRTPWEHAESTKLPSRGLKESET